MYLQDPEASKKLAILNNIPIQNNIDNLSKYLQKLNVSNFSPQFQAEVQEEVAKKLITLGKGKTKTYLNAMNLSHQFSDPKRLIKKLNALQQKKIKK